MSFVEVDHVGKTYQTVGGGSFRALDDVNLSIGRGEFVCLLGPSGCGKSTLLAALAGFVPASEGIVRIDGREVSGPSSSRITIFQQYGLFPWRSVLSNVEFGLEGKAGVSRRERERIAREYIELVGLQDFADSRPSELSGGMQQRVSIARALATNPDVLFMDEPFGALDAITRMKLQDDLLRIAKEAGKTVVFVTHDIDEAVYLSDRIVVMTPNPGRVKQVVDVPMSWGSRDRTSDDFIACRDKVFEIFNMKHEAEIEYVI